MADPQVAAAMQYMQEQRNQIVIDNLLNSPAPSGQVWTAAEIAAHLWPQGDQPSVSDAELEAALKFLEGATGQQREETLTMQAQPEGGVAGPAIPVPPSRGGLPGGFPIGIDGPWIPGPADSAAEIFMHWLLNPLSTPFNTPSVSLTSKEKLAAVTAAIKHTKSEQHLKHLIGLQAAYFHQARNEGH